MKKFMLLAVVAFVALLSGCATENHRDTEVILVPSGGGQYQQAVRYQRPEARPQTQTQSAKQKKEARLTVNNYMEKGAVEDVCQSGNWEMDSICLYSWSIKLDEMQKACKREAIDNIQKKMKGLPWSVSADCSKNPGVLSGEYAVLADELEKLQTRARAGIMTDRYKQ